MSRSTTMNRGADDERAALKRLVKKALAGVSYDDATVSDYKGAFQKVLDGIASRAKRTAAKVGGLGRK